MSGLSYHLSSVRFLFLTEEEIGGEKVGCINSISYFCKFLALSDNFLPEAWTSECFTISAVCFKGVLALHHRLHVHHV